MAISREAVIYGFKFFLGRDPESEEGIQAHMNLPDEKSLAKVLIQSKEFSIKRNLDFSIQTNNASNNNDGNEWAIKSKIKIIVVGNCQASGIATLLQAMSEDVVTKFYETTDKFLTSLKNGDLDTISFSECDLIFAHPRNDWIEILESRVIGIRNKVKYIPPIAFSAFHPDCVYVENKEKNHVASPIGAYNSSLAFYGWSNGLSLKNTIGLFSEEIYDALGFFDYWNSSVASLKSAWDFSELTIDSKVIRNWSRHGSWMHSINHPKLFVLADVARAALTREKITHIPNVEDFLKDNLTIHPCWPVYPEIGNALGIPTTQPFFKKGEGLCPSNRPIGMLNLEKFVEQSFIAYDKHKQSNLTCERLKNERYQKLHDIIKNKSAINQTVKYFVNLKNTLIDQKGAVKINHNPYKNLADYQFWRRSIERISMQDIDPVVRSGFTLNKTDKVATAGSCFAQHISRTLQKQGFNYYVAEIGDEKLNSTEADQKNYGVFSARFGNLYSARQLVQLFDRAYGSYYPQDKVWTRDDGKYVDPFRPQVEPDGFNSIDALENDRNKHFFAVREMFEKLDVFVFTLGLTEAWRRRSDGAIFPLAPGVVAGEMNHDIYEFVNFNVGEVVSDLQNFITRLLSVNPKAKMIITVSPVPLIATYEDRHVLVSTTYSKSALRAAAEEICKQNKNCEYFPSYEIITGNYTKGEYFESDLRSVKPEGVEHVMRLFMQHYSSEAQITEQPKSSISPVNSLDAELMKENERISGVICDEEALDAGN